MKYSHTLNSFVLHALFGLSAVATAMPSASAGDCDSRRATADVMRALFGPDASLALDQAMVFKGRTLDGAQTCVLRLERDWEDGLVARLWVGDGESENGDKDEVVAAQLAFDHYRTSHLHRYYDYAAFESASLVTATHDGSSGGGRATATEYSMRIRGFRMGVEQGLQSVRAESHLSSHGYHVDKKASCGGLTWAGYSPLPR